MRALRLARTCAGPLITLAVLAMSATLLVAALPRTMESAYDAALASDLRAAPGDDTDLTVTRAAIGEPGEPHDPAAFQRQDAELRAQLPAGLRPLITGDAGHYALRSSNTPVVAGAGVAHSYVDLAWISTVDRRIRWVAGRPPHASGRGHFEIALVRQAAREMRLPVGTELTLNLNGPTVTITGLFEVKDPHDRFWDHNKAVRAISRERIPQSDDYELHITGLVSQRSLESLQLSKLTLEYSWVLALDPAAADSRAAPGVLDALSEFDRRVGVLAGDGWNRFALLTDLPRLLTGYLARQAAAAAVMYVVLGGLFVVALGVLALAVQLIVRRTEQSLALARARGGSLARVAGTGTALVALAAVPAVAAGYAGSLAVRGPALPLVHVGPLVIVLATVTGAAVLFARAHRSPLRERREGVAGRPSVRRIAIEVAVVGLVLAGVYLLRSRGMSGADPFLLLVPFSLTVAAAILTLRLYPYPLGLLARLAAGRAGAPAFLGLTMAARARPLSALPVLVLLPALSVSVFAAVVASGVASTQSQAAWREVGADARISTIGAFAPEAIERVRRVPGVEAVAPAQVTSVGLPNKITETLVAIDVNALRDVVRDAPVEVPARPPAGAGIPALVPPALMGAPIQVMWDRQVTLTPVGSVTSFPGQRADVIVVPFGAQQRVRVNTLYVRGHDLDEARLAAAAGGGDDTRAFVLRRVLRDIEDAPLTAMVRHAFILVTLAMAGYALVAVVLALVVTAAERGAALAFLRTLGLSGRQARRLTVLQVAPLILLTTLAGVGLGLGLPPYFA